MNRTIARGEQFETKMIRSSVSRYTPTTLPVSHSMMSLHAKVNLSANQISSTYLNPRLRHNYFRFGKTNVRHIGIFLPFTILTRSQ